jgi:predicted aconitase with swiveling domain
MNRPDSSSGTARATRAARDPLEFAAHTLAAGSAGGAPLAVEPLSFWGGYDAARGLIVEPAHPQCGLSLAGKVMLMQRAKGSSSSSSVLAEAIRNGTGPVAIILCEADLIIAIGVIVAQEMYRANVPLVTVDAEAFAALCAAGSPLYVDAPGDGGQATVRIE